MTSAATENLLQTYNAYNSRRGLREDPELTHVGRGTPLGEYLRRYWQPVAYEEDVTDLPLRLRILGEDLVLFRSGSGAYGLVEGRCSHRGASLEYGVISEQGIRCAYHGFHYAPDGTILETGSGAPMANAGKLCHGAYPLFVFAGLIFAYMGPSDKQPPFPMLDVYDDPHITVEPARPRSCETPCNWLQIHENGMDPVHTAYLHALTTGTQRGFSDEMGVLPILQWTQNENGMHYIASRRLGDLVWVRVVDSFMPNYALIPPSDEGSARTENISQRPYSMTFIVPIDDTNSKRLYLQFNDDRNPLRQVQKDRSYGQVGRPYDEAQRFPGDHDMMTSQGPITIHAGENLTPTDYGVIALRQLLRDGIRAVAEGRDPLGISRDPNYRIRTRTQNTFVRVPPAATPDADAALLKQAGREIADSDSVTRLQPV